MSCCAPGVEPTHDDQNQAVDEIRLASRPLGDGLRQSRLSVPTMHCGGCLRRIEQALGALEGVEFARANLSAKRVTVNWRDSDTTPPLLETLVAQGYSAHLDEPDADAGDPVLKRLIRAIAVAGFAAANIMLLSVSVWSGAEAATRDLFHWISALIALPAMLYSGRVFFDSAWQAVRVGRLNMDVPISLAIILAYAMSLYETANHGEHAYFDAATTLMFFLLIGRTLDHVMRERARSAVTGLARLTPRGAVVLDDEGNRDFVELDEVRPGMRLFVAVGERIPVDGTVVSGASDIDCSIATGESAPVAAVAGDTVRAGTLNLTGSLTICASAAAQDSFLAEMRRMMEAAEGGRARYRRIADRAADIYAPAVHLAAFVTFIGWWWLSGDLHHSIYTAIAVLIITCPCALGLAVPVVQVVAARRLFDAGVMVKDGSALERLAECDSVVFDKTGTLTTPDVRITDMSHIDEQSLAIASSMAANSNHPYSRAIASLFPGSVQLPTVLEIPGHGLEAEFDGEIYRLGRAEWALGKPTVNANQVVLARQNEMLAQFRMTNDLRADARAAVSATSALGLKPEIVSGDRPDMVAQIATDLNIDRFTAEAMPDDKLGRLEAIKSGGGRALMVGDGINDAPALAAAHASMAPATAADIGRSAADLVFLHDSLKAVPFAVDTARRAAVLIRQNFALAVIYNLIAVPAAIFGFVTPLIAALAMSGSSIVVIANAMRLNLVPMEISAKRDRAAVTEGVVLAEPAAPALGNR